MVILIPKQKDFAMAKNLLRNLNSSLDLQKPTEKQKQMVKYLLTAKVI